MNDDASSGGKISSGKWWMRPAPLPGRVLIGRWWMRPTNLPGREPWGKWWMRPALLPGRVPWGKWWRRPAPGPGPHQSSPQRTRSRPYWRRLRLSICLVALFFPSLNLSKSVCLFLQFLFKFIYIFIYQFILFSHLALHAKCFHLFFLFF